MQFIVGNWGKCETKQAKAAPNEGPSKDTRILS